MKKLLCLLFVLPAFIACSSDNDTDSNQEEKKELQIRNVKELLEGTWQYVDATSEHPKRELFSTDGFPESSGAQYLLTWFKGLNGYAREYGGKYEIEINNGIWLNREISKSNNPLNLTDKYYKIEHISEETLKIGLRKENSSDMVYFTFNKVKE